MIFGKIEYLNLLPFHIFMKRFLRSSQEQHIMRYKRDVPARINEAFLTRRVDAAFISSIKAKKAKHSSVGIVAKGAVESVIVIPAKQSQSDKESASSNILATILKQEGKVLIGDKALRYTRMHTEYVDLAKLWSDTTGMPFVFAILCYHKESKRYKKIEQNFLRQHYKIPYYILHKAAQESGVSPDDIRNYLKLISYKIDYKAKRGLKRFYQESRQLS